MHDNKTIFSAWVLFCSSPAHWIESSSHSHCDNQQFIICTLVTIFDFPQQLRIKILHKTHYYCALDSLLLTLACNKLLRKKMSVISFYKHQKQIIQFGFSDTNASFKSGVNFPTTNYLSNRRRNELWHVQHEINVQHDFPQILEKVYLDNKV